MRCFLLIILVVLVVGTSGCCLMPIQPSDTELFPPVEYSTTNSDEVV